jgi:GntR family galactonate operon transcriptional repressor
MHDLRGASTQPGIGGPAGIHAGVVQAIGRRIVRGELGPGEILPEQTELSRLLGVSRTVVREATKVLATKGLVESRSKRGTVVLPRSSWRLLDPDVLTWLTEAGPDPAFLRNVFEVRRIIEPAAARLAAERASPAELEAIGGALEAMATAADGAAYLLADVQYHEILVAATHNAHLVQLVAAFGPAFQAGLRAATRNAVPWPDFHESGLTHHRAARAMEWLVDQSLDERISGYEPAG